MLNPDDAADIDWLRKCGKRRSKQEEKCIATALRLIDAYDDYFNKINGNNIKLPKEIYNTIYSVKKE